MARISPALHPLSLRVKELMSQAAKELDVVALLRDAPEHGLRRGQVGTVVDDRGGSVLVEFADSDGQTFALAGFEKADLLVLSYEHVAAE